MVLGARVALVGREAKPLRALDGILRDTLAVGIRNPEIILGGCKALLSQGAGCSGGELAINFFAHHSPVTVATRTVFCELRQTLIFMDGGDANFELGTLPVHVSRLVSQA